MTKIKICGLFRNEDILAVNEALPDYAGFIINYPKSHRNVSFEKVRELTSVLDKKIQSVGVFVNEDINNILKLCDENIIDIIQLHGYEDNEYVRTLKEKTGKSVIKAFIIKNEDDIKKAELSLADYVLLDGGMGEGRQFDHEYIKLINRPFFIAGGLTPENISIIAKTTNAFAVDISSGVETDRIKDKMKILNVVNALRRKDD